MLTVIPIFLGKAITELNTMIDRTIASVLPSGSVSALSYGNRVGSLMLKKMRPME